MAKKSTRSTTKSTAEGTKKVTAAKKTAAPKKEVATAKKPAAKKTVSAKAPAPKPAAATPTAVRATTAKAASSQPRTPTTISAKVDIGFGNMLYIRGEGPGLSWNRGVPMDCVAADEWVWSTKSATSSFSCKVLINDEIWSTGEDFVVPPGERLVCYPSF